MRKVVGSVALAMCLVPASASTQSIGLSVFADAAGNDHQNLNGEYVTVSNNGGSSVDIGGWTLCDAASHCFTFPRGASIPANGSIRLYTGSGRTTATRFYMGSRRAVWNNDGDVATLTDPSGRVVARTRY